MRRSVARVKHNGFVGVDVFVIFLLSCTLHLAGWWDEAARANFTRPRTMRPAPRLMCNWYCTSDFAGAVSPTIVKIQFTTVT